MICKNCGAQIPDGSAFCTECGAPVQQEQPVQQEPVQQPQYTPVQQTYTAEPTPAVSGKPVLICGILALALNSIPYVGWIAGLICAIIGMKKAKAYVAANGQLTGAAKVGRILSIVGLVCSIVMAFVWLIVIIVAIIGAASGVIQSSIDSIDLNF